MDHLKKSTKNMMKPDEDHNYHKYMIAVGVYLATCVLVY